MQIFYAPGINGDIHYLDENESRHCIRVLRMTEGSRVTLVDGKGNLFEGYISNPDQKRCQISITGIVRDFEKRDYRLHIAVSPLKNQDRFEWFVEKSVETGIDEITPIYCKNTEKQGIKTERINNIIISAMKQSIKTVKTEFHQPVSFTDFIKSDFAGVRMIAHCSNKTERTGISSVYTRGNDATILIGPEGDFSEEEIKMAVRQGFKSVHLGNSRFRTETAGVAACLAVYFINQ
jgi:16S rRNA (uracil1498-N3)-methyltransferase